MEKDYSLQPYPDPRTEVSVNLVRDLRKEQENKLSLLETLAEGAVHFVMKIPQKAHRIYQLVKSKIEQY
jgi:hypothetical protein